MNRRIVYHALAELELNDAAQYYEHECDGLGAAFLAEVQRCSESILDYPEAGMPIHTVVRRRLVARFPYALLYTARPDAIRIVAVMNVKRRPFYWLGRR